MKKSFLLLNITTFGKLFSSTCSVQLTCHIFIIFYFWFQVNNSLSTKKHIRLLFEKKKIIIGLFWLLTLIVLSKQNYLTYKNKQK